MKIPSKVPVNNSYKSLNKTLRVHICNFYRTVKKQELTKPYNSEASTITAFAEFHNHHSKLSAVNLGRKNSLNLNF